MRNTITKKHLTNIKKSSQICQRTAAFKKKKQDKRRAVGVAIMNRTKYLDKCYTILDSNQFTKRDQDPTCYMENKVQGTLRKVKSTMPQTFYSKLYPSGSCPGKFYGTAKMHKLLTNNVDDLPLRPII